MREVPFETHGMFGERARLYDRIYHWKDYAAESEALHALLQAEGVADGARLVDAACGTGTHLVELAKWYDVSGFDLAEPMLAIARTKLPGVSLVEGDLADFTVDRPADVVTCLFSAFGCVYPEERIRASAHSFARALAPGGVALIEPWIQPESFIPDHVSVQTALDGLPKLVRVCRTRLDGRKTALEFTWLVCSPDGIEQFEETQVLWLSTRDELLGAFRGAGLDARWEHPGPMGRGLVVAKKPA